MCIHGWTTENILELKKFEKVVNDLWNNIGGQLTTNEEVSESQGSFSLSTKVKHTSELWKLCQTLK